MSRSLGLVSAATDDASPLQEIGEDALTVSRAVGSMAGAPRGAYGVTLDESTV